MFFFVRHAGCDLYFPQQFQEKLRLSCRLYGVDYVDPPDNVKTHWWCTYLMFEALLQFREPLSMSSPVGVGVVGP